MIGSVRGTVLERSTSGEVLVGNGRPGFADRDPARPSHTLFRLDAG